MTTTVTGAAVPAPPSRLRTIGRTIRTLVRRAPLSAFWGVIAFLIVTMAVAAPAIAAEHCARFDKAHRITSVHRQYGDYISFQCLWNPRMARYAIPPVRTRTVCYAHARKAPAIRVLY